MKSNEGAEVIRIVFALADTKKKARKKLFSFDT